MVKKHGILTPEELDEQQRRETEKKDIIEAARRPLMGLLGFCIGGSIMGLLAFLMIFPMWASTSNHIVKLEKQMKRQVAKTETLQQRVDMQENRGRVVVDQGLVDRLNARFVGTDLAGMGEKMIIDAGAYGIDPRILAGVAVVETGGNNRGPIGIFGGLSNPADSPAIQIEKYCKYLYENFGSIQRGWQVASYEGEGIDVQWRDWVEQVRNSL